VSSIHYVYISQANAKRSSDHPVLTSTYCDPLLTWIDNHTLQISYTSLCSIRQFENKWYSPSDVQNAQKALHLIKSV
jgi:hypothetical protein